MTTLARKGNIYEKIICFLTATFLKPMLKKTLKFWRLYKEEIESPLLWSLLTQRGY